MLTFGLVQSQFCLAKTFCLDKHINFEYFFKVIFSNLVSYLRTRNYKA